MSLFKNMSATSLVLARVAFALALIGSCILAFTPADRYLQQQMNDKLLHFSAFVVLALMARAAFPLAPALILAFCMSFFGAFIEVVQSYLPYRQFSWLDLLADMAGVMFYFILFEWTMRLPRKFEPD